ncbi:MAG: type I 3-dehydroquinate dehydratase [Syntrophales bacterium]|nr:type I 3-dehydroquinate dehydratase [Syntrophales bacterium]
MICIPVTGKTTAEAAISMSQAFSLSDAVELRIDGMQAPDLKRLLRSKKGKILVTNRRSEEGGAFAESENHRCELLLEAIELGADMIDVELGTDKAILKKIVDTIKEKGERTELIISFHDFGGTPGTRRLRSIFEEARAEGAHIVKIVTMARNLQDNLKILDLLQWAENSHRKIIGFCMGDKGKISRIAAPLFGSCITYAALDNERATAPGQLTVQEAKMIYRLLIGDGFTFPRGEM